MNNKGVTLIELLVVLVIGGMMIVSVGAVTDIGKQSQIAMQEQASIFNGLTYGFKLLQNRVHEGLFATPVAATLGAPWIGERLEIGQFAFGIYDQTGNTKDFVYLPDKTTTTNMQTLVSVLDTDTLTNTITITGSDTVELTVSGTRDDIPFSMTTTVSKRR